MKNKNMASAQSQLGAKLQTMSYHECIEYIRNSIASTFGFLPKQYSMSFTELLNKLESDYAECEAERDAAITERDEALAKLAATEVHE